MQCCCSVCISSSKWVNSKRKQAIRVKHLATHSSGLSDSIVYSCSYFLTTEPQINFYQQLGLLTDSQCPDGFSRDTDHFIQQYTSSGVPGYQLSENFNDYQPGLGYDYSNVGAGLLGQLIGLASGESINHFIQKNIFDPLMMVNSGYSEADFNAYPYRSKNYLASDSGTNEHAEYAYPTYADGSLYSSANDLARYLMALSNKGQLNGQQILTPESIETLFSPLITDDEGSSHGLFWEVEDALIYHSGGDPGVSTLIILNRETQIGIVVLANSTDIMEEDSTVDMITGVLLALIESIDH